MIIGVWAVHVACARPKDNIHLTCFNVKGEARLDFVAKIGDIFNNNTIDANIITLSENDLSYEEYVGT